MARGLKMRAAALIISLWLLLCFAPPASAGTVPRDSPEFTIATPGGSTTLLSSLKGKVVVMEFLFVSSEHCLRVARTLNKLYAELGAQGFEPVAVVFDPPHAERTGGPLAMAMARAMNLTFPVGYTSKEEVDTYLGRARDEILNIPQIVVIDRRGMIRAASGGRGGDPALEDESSLRVLIDALLKEGSSAGTGAK